MEKLSKGWFKEINKRKATTDIYIQVRVCVCLNSTSRQRATVRLSTRDIYRNWTTATAPIKAASICNPSRRTVLVSR